jgi:hypothetical protein
MPDISIPNVSAEIYAILKEKAAADGKGLETWLRERLIMLAAQPIVKAHYELKAYGPGPAFARIHRREGDESVGGSVNNLSQEQMKAVRKATDYVRRNRLGDREEAHNLLARNFETVFETPL